MIATDRTLVAEVGTNSSFLTPEVHLYDRRTGEVRIVPYEEDRSFERDAAFSPDSRRIAVSTTLGSTVSFAIRVLDLVTETTEVVELTEPPNGLAWIAEDQLAVVVGGDDIQTFDLSTGPSTTIYTRVSFFEPENLIASPDGDFLAWRESDDLYVMPSTGGTPDLVTGAVESSEFVWIGDRTLAFKGFPDGICFYDVDSMVSTPIGGTESVHTLRGLGASGVVSAFNGLNLLWVYADGRIVELGEPPDFPGAFVEWSADLALGMTSGFTLAISESTGRFELEERLVPGLNVLTARATDEAGNTSPDSDALELTYDTSALADLTVDGAMTVIPSAPTTGDTASVSVAVFNRGEGGSAETTLSVTGSDLDGNVYCRRREQGDRCGRERFERARPGQEDDGVVAEGEPRRVEAKLTPNALASPEAQRALGRSRRSRKRRDPRARPAPRRS